MSVRLHLAPMEGVVDFVLRDFLTSIGGIDHCVTEFVRVSDRAMPDFVIERFAPELRMGCRTRAGTPLFIQLLGGQPEPMAETAVRAANLGALGIDLNFGCPAKTVNRHDGGASLLKCPDRMYHIISAVRRAVSAEIPVTAKMRLGFEDPGVCIENAQAVESAGAKWLTIHCRTKTDGYKPPAYWEWIPKIKEHVSLPIVSNGEIWNVEDFKRCREVTGSEQFMIGRGAIAEPFIFKKIKEFVSNEELVAEPSACVPDFETWPEIKKLLPSFFQSCVADKSGNFAQARTKQWLRQLALKHKPATEIFDELKVCHDPLHFQSRLEHLCS